MIFSRSRRVVGAAATLTPLLRSRGSLTPLHRVRLLHPTNTPALAVPARHFHQTVAAQKIVTFNLADIGEAIAEVELVQWLVKEGQKVEQFDQLCVVESDKATVPISSRYKGTVVKLYYAEGAMAATGKPLVDIETDDIAAIASEPETKSAPAPAVAPASAATSPGDSAPAACAAVNEGSAPGKVAMTPAVRALVHREKVNLALVTATGKGGRVLKDDVLAYLSAGRAAAAASAAETAETAEAKSPSGAKAPSAADRVEPIKGIRRAMAKTMTASLKIPHFGYSDEILLNRLMETRERLKPLALANGVKLSFMPFFLKAASLALLEFPILNSHVDDECTTITFKGDHNIGVAMDTPSGLLVPNIKRVQLKSVFEIAAELNALQKRGAERLLSSEDLSDGTFTLSNIGTVGGTYLGPVISVPQVAIGATGSTQKLPRFDSNDNVYAAHVMQVSWSADHRVIDGVTMAKFSNVWKQYLENPDLMLLKLK